MSGYKAIQYIILMHLKVLLVGLRWKPQETHKNYETMYPGQPGQAFYPSKSAYMLLTKVYI